MTERPTFPPAGGLVKRADVVRAPQPKAVVPEKKQGNKAVTVYISQDVYDPACRTLNATRRVEADPSCSTSCGRQDRS